LSGGALGCAWTGAPTFRENASAQGSAPTPATGSETGASGARPTLIVSPGAAWRFAAACWVSSAPDPAPARCRTSAGKAAS
jgi:hypothetical protein